MGNGPYFARSKGKITGPFDYASMKRLIERGVVSQADELSIDGSRWQGAADFRELFAADSPVEAENVKAEPLFVRSRGKITGPFDLPSLRRLVQRGLLSRADQVSKNKIDWIPSSEVDGVFAAAQPAVAHRETKGADALPEEPPASPRQATGPAAIEAPAACAACGGVFAVRQLFNENGRLLCPQCHSVNLNLASAGRSNPVARRVAMQGGDEGASYQGMAITSFVLSLVSLLYVLGIITAPLAIIFAGVAMGGMKKSGNRNGHGLAVAGLVIGIIITTLWLIVFVAGAWMVIATHRYR